MNNLVGLAATHQVAYAAIWLANIMYLAALFPQIRMNYRLKSARGLSDFMIVGFIFGYLTQIIFVFALDMPLPYKILLPLGLCGTLVITMQRLLYHPIRASWFFIGLSIASWVFALSGIPFAIKYPEQTGQIFGWISTGTWAVYQIPQAIKMFNARSTRGFSFAFATSLAFGVLIELISAIYLQLPLPQIINNARGLLAYGVFCLEYFYFRKS